jgi:hypothetical protein
MSPNKANMYSLGEKAGLKKREVSLMIDEVSEIISEWGKYAKLAGVSDKSLKTIQDKINFNLLNR